MDGEQPGPQIIQKHNPTYRTEPKEDQKFDPAAVKEVVDAIFLEQIEKKNLVWDEEECRELSLDLCDEIKEKVKALAFPRYKIIVQVSVGENKKQGVLVTSDVYGIQIRITMPPLVLKTITFGLMRSSLAVTHSKPVSFIRECVDGQKD